MSKPALAESQHKAQLPTVSYREVVAEPALLKPVVASSARIRPDSYGYNDNYDFSRPVHYIRYIEPIETELAVQVEYDMDEQDQAWIDAINIERKKNSADAITYEMFEIILDKLEKEWFNLIKRIPQPASHMPVEDSKCAVCDDGEGENSNAIVFCDGCNLAVHQDCYGVPYIPEGQWLCRKCTVSPENPVSCLVCPNEGGAFKQTTSGHWAHLLCAIWIPELTLGNAIYMEPIDGTEIIPKNRWRLNCSLCRERMGACIQCENRSCFTAFHVTCARQMGYLMAMKSVHNDGSLKAFCDKHLPDELRKDTFDDEFDDHTTTPQPKHRRHSQVGPAVTTKTARAHAKSYRPGPPVVPHLIVQQLLEYVSKLDIRKKEGFIEKLCRYWSLKREARRGAPLLKRLHLEPWTASNAGRQQTEAEKAQKLAFLKLLRNDLEKVRMLAEQVRKREQAKLKQAQVIKDVVDTLIFPGYSQLRLTLEKVSAKDGEGVFQHPVNRFEVPDYYELIKEPMSWQQIDEKLEKFSYRNMSEFKYDTELVLDNAMLYNPPAHEFHKLAKKIKTSIQPFLLKLDEIATPLDPPVMDGGVSGATIEEGTVGDLEPSTSALGALLQSSELSEDKDNLTSIFTFELSKPRPPTPPPPPPPPPKEKPPKPTAEQVRQRREEREAAARERLIARPTRSAVAANNAFAQEVGLITSDNEAHSRQTSGEPRTNRRAGRPSRLKPPAEDQAEPLSTAEASSSSRPRNQRQVGVVAVETFAYISDKERRKHEMSMDLVTEEVGNKDQFSRFNVGWVLPEGTKRKRSERPDTLGVPRARTNTTSPLITSSSLPSQATSRKSVEAPPPSSPLSAMSSGDLTPPDSDHEEPKPPPPKMRSRVIVDIQGGASKAPNSASSKKRRAPDYPPSFGRGKRRRRESTVPLPASAENDMDVDAENAAGDDDLTPIPITAAPSPALPCDPTSNDLTPMPGSSAPPTPVNQPPRRGGRKSTRRSNVNQSSPTTVEIQAEETTEMPVATGSGEGSKPTKEKAGRASRSRAMTPEVIEELSVEQEGEEVPEESEEPEIVAEGDEDNLYPPGTLVWAKIRGYPFFPAEIIDQHDDDIDIPDAIIDIEPDVDGEPHWLIRFFEKPHSFAWLTEEHLDRLGVDDKVDGRHLDGKGKNGGTNFKNQKHAAKCRKAYRDAMSFKEQRDTIA